MRNGDHNLWKGVVAGAAGGLVASWLMNQFQTGWNKAASELSDPHEPWSASPQGEQERHADADDATMKTTEKISEALFHRRLSREEKKRLSPVVHYAFGAGTGAIYGVIAEIEPRATFGAGLPYGTAVFVGADEVLVPTFGLSKPPKEYPASAHLYGLASHLVYGLSLEMARRGIRRMMD